MHTVTRNTRKSVRLLFLWLKKQLDEHYTATNYIKDTGVDKSVASRDLNFDLPALNEVFNLEFPAIRDALLRLFRPEWLDNLPLVRGTDLGDTSTMTVKFTVNHVTGDVCWDTFDQVIFKDGVPVSVLKNFGGSRTCKSS